MADNKMLIDATHPEETRVVVLRNGRVEEFDYESAARKLLRGSIFLAKVTRVEPSLQAAFVDYGGNRHGFLAFNEIHPDYYQIPHSDRQALIEEEIANRFDDGDDDQAEDDIEPDDEAGMTRDDGNGVTTEAAGAGECDTMDTVGGDATGTSEQGEADAVEVTDDDLADPDIEAGAIDVTEYLPPESDGDALSAGTREDEAGPADDESARSVVAAADATDATDGASGEDSENPNDGSRKNGGASGPKTIAAAVSPDDRITSEIVEPTATQEGLDAQDPDTEAAAPETNDKADDPADTAAEPAADQTGDGDVSGAEDAAQTGSEASPAHEAVSREAASREAGDTGSDDDDLSETRGDDAVADKEDDVARTARAPREDDGEEADDDDSEDDAIVDVGDDADVMEEVPVRRRRRMRNYKIQEVIKRRQVVLVQVVKEERGNKGAALTTYLSLAGRYTVLMPNTARGGGISRKITNLQDRKRLKAIAQELDVPEGMGLIIRTAGAARTKQEIKRDFEYLLRLWENVRDLTLQSTAPSLVYEEGDLIKRSIRDLYSKDVEQVVVAGDEAHKEAKSFMRMLMPSHAKNVVKYDEPQPLFARYRIEQQLNAMFSPFVHLKSGGYLVINQTEALVAVDVNSGKSTRKFSIEDTALNTNLEAAEELARQLKLRDLAGLIVIDFIDMEEKRNNRAVERRLKECLRDDRARIQVGRISHFGLLEMSRQRLRTGVLEGSTMPCHHCQGTGIIRSTESVALALLRTLEDNLMGGSPRSLRAHCSREVAMYLLNNKRHFVLDMEARYGISVHIVASDDQQGAEFAIERMGGGAPPQASRKVERSAVNVEAGFTESSDDGDEVAESSNEDGERRTRRRRRRRGRRGDVESQNDDTVEAREDLSGDDAGDSGDGAAQNDDDGGDGDGDERAGRRRRRGRRGGRRNRGERANPSAVAVPGAPQPDIAPAADGKPNGDGDGSGDVSASAQEGDLEPAQGDARDDIAVTRIEITAPGVEASAGDIGEAADHGLSADDAQPSDAIDTSHGHDDSEAVAEASSDDTRKGEPASASDVSAEEGAPEEITPADGEALPASEPDVDVDLAAADDDGPVATDDEAARANGAPRGEPVSSAPVLESVVVTPEHAQAAREADGESQDDAAQRPARKGWWQRRFGG